MSDEEVMELSIADEDEGEEEMTLSLAGDEEAETGEAETGTAVEVPTGGGWSVTLKNPTIKIEKLVVKRKD